jgi:hypothetical protein
MPDQREQGDLSPAVGIITLFSPCKISSARVSLARTLILFWIRVRKILNLAYGLLRPGGTRRHTRKVKLTLISEEETLRKFFGFYGPDCAPLHLRGMLSWRGQSVSGSPRSDQPSNNNFGPLQSQGMSQNVQGILARRCNSIIPLLQTHACKENLVGCVRWPPGLNHGNSCRQRIA